MDKAPIRVAQIMGKWNGGGVESVIMNYYRYIDKSKIQFDFICDEDSKRIPKEEIEKMGGRVIIVPPYQKLNKYIKSLRKIFKDNKYKIVHSNISTLSVFPLYAAYKENIIIRIAHCHNTSNPKEFKRNIIKNLLRPFSKIFATDYFACSELAGRYLFGNKTYNQGKVIIINNSIEIEKFRFNSKVRNKKRKELGIDKDTLVIGHVGRFVKQKNHEFLIDIFKVAEKTGRKCKLLLIGEGPLKEKIKEKVNKLGLIDDVIFLGQRNDVNELYSTMDVFIFPSLYEGLGLVLIEAQYSGLQCICSDEIPNVVKISNLIKFIKLTSSPDEWVRNINFNKNRREIDNKIQSKEFDIKNDCIKYEKYLLNRIGEKMKKTKNEKKYSYKYFKEGLPEWKRIKDPLTSRIFYRPVSFYTASIASNSGISANTISYFSIFIAIFACILLIIPNRICNIMGAIFVNLWLLSDCTDGNIARCVKKQPFGAFADSISSYILVGLLGTSIGINAYFNGGVIFEKECIWIVLLGAIASSADTLMRLIYQKYKSSERELEDLSKLKVEKEKRTSENQTNSFIVRIESDFGIGGILPILVLIGIVFNCIDLIVIYCFLYYFLSSIAMILKYIFKAINKTKEIELNEERGKK